MVAEIIPFCLLDVVNLAFQALFYLVSQGAEYEMGPTFSGQAGNDFFSKIIPPKSYFGQKKILLP